MFIRITPITSTRNGTLTYKLTLLSSHRIYGVVKHIYHGLIGYIPKENTNDERKELWSKVYVALERANVPIPVKHKIIRKIAQKIPRTDEYRNAVRLSRGKGGDESVVTSCSPSTGHYKGKSRE